MQTFWFNYRNLILLLPVLIFAYGITFINVVLNLDPVQLPTNFTLSPFSLRTYLQRSAHITGTRANRGITTSSSQNGKMAWACSGRTNAQLISNMWNAKLIHSDRVRDAMMSIDRAHYTPSHHLAYEDSPQSIGHSATISAPHMHASALEKLLPYLGEGMRVLDIGSGSGYLTACMAELVFPSSSSTSSSCSSTQNPGEAEGRRTGKVVGLEHIRELRNLGENNMAKSEKGIRWLRERKVEFVVGDGREGWIDADGEEGWDAIHVGAAAIEIHEALIEQLRSPGRMFIPVEHPRGLGQHIWVVDKDREGNISKEMLYGVRYVPLTDAPTTHFGY